MLLETPAALVELRTLLLAGPCAGERVATAFPKDAPGRLVRIERIGGRPLVEAIVEFSHTCYLGDRTHRHAWGYGCGECPACELRAAGYAEWVASA